MLRYVKLIRNGWDVVGLGVIFVILLVVGVFLFASQGTP